MIEEQTRSTTEVTSRFEYENQAHDDEESYDGRPSLNSRLEILNVTKKHSKTESGSEETDEDDMQG